MKRLLIVAFLLMTPLLCGAGEIASTPKFLRGQVLAGQTPISNSTVTLYGSVVQCVPDPCFSTSEPVEKTKTDAYGWFSLDLSRAGAKTRTMRGEQWQTPQPDTLYVVATGGSAGGGYNPKIKLITVFGRVPVEAHIIVNELTTVSEAMVFGNSISHPDPEQLALYRQVVDPVTGNLQALITHTAESAAIVNTLADIANSCTSSRGSAFAECKSLLQAATAPRFTPPNNTLAAIENIVSPYGRANAAVFSLLGSRRPYTPVLKLPPSGWLLSLNLGQIGLDDPTEILADKSNSTVWILNRGDQSLTELSAKPDDLSHPLLGKRKVPTAARHHPIDFSFDQPFSSYPPSPRPPQPGWFSKPSVWLLDDGILFLKSSGEVCDTPLGNLGLKSPRGLANCDISGNSVCVTNTGADEILIVHKPDANCGGAALVGRLPRVEKPASATPFDRPAHIVKCIIDNSDDWITNSRSNSINVLHSFRCTVAAAAPFSGGGLASPEGLACDNQGNVWIANHGLNANSISAIKATFFGIHRPLVNAHCLNAAGMDEPYEVMLEALSPPSGFSGVGLNHPYGVAVDALGNLWITNEGNNSVTIFVAVGQGV